MSQIVMNPPEARSITKEFGETRQLYKGVYGGIAVVGDFNLPKADQFADLMGDFDLVIQRYAHLIERDEKRINNYIDRMIKADEAT